MAKRTKKLEAHGTLCGTPQRPCRIGLIVRPLCWRRWLQSRWGPGYRVYYAMIGKECVLLLCGGDKRKQSPDIDRALEYFKDYKERTGT
jgi:hypothetical protein